VKKVIFHEKSEIKSEKSEISEKSEFVEALFMKNSIFDYSASFYRKNK
jgi:hypothetical protein